MQVYHGTNAAKLPQIEAEGVDEPSYWTNNYAVAKEYADSHGNGVVLAVALGQYDFKANMGVARCLFENEDIDELPDESDLTYSLEYLEGIVCHDRVRDFDVVRAPPSTQ